ncbi:MAG: methyltransferase type 11 [Candidatus Cloacimonadota bacterium]|nr:MAG: methyltransferase type 11 [Candidatus Cloacimonadota bacterium]
MTKDKKFWDKLAKSYNKLFENDKSYRKMYALMRENLNKNMKVLEIGTASGITARAVSDKVKDVSAVDFSEKMIEKAKSITEEKNISFAVMDAADLHYPDKSFDAVIIANVLHIVEKPENVLKEIKRVLKDDGMMIAPNFMWKETGFIGKIQKFIMIKRGFPVYSEWNSEEYTEFLRQNYFSCIKRETIKWNFNICYVECMKIN